MRFVLSNFCLVHCLSISFSVNTSAVHVSTSKRLVSSVRLVTQAVKTYILQTGLPSTAANMNLDRTDDVLTCAVNCVKTH